MRVAKNLFGAKSSRITRVLLAAYPKTWTIEKLSKEARVSLGYTHAVVAKLLEERHAVKDERGELRVLGPVRLLKRWAAFNSFQTSNVFLHYYSFEQDIGKFLSELKKKKGPEYALTALSGALLVAPFVRPTTLHFYVKNKPDAVKWAGLLGLKPVEGSGNVVFVLPADEGVFYGCRKMDGVKVVSDAQLYADLYNYPARGEEAAGELLKAIEKKWAAKS